MFGEGEEGGVFFTHVVENADGGGSVVREANDFAARASEFALKRQDARGGRVEMLLEEVFENVHENEFRYAALKYERSRAISSIAETGIGRLRGRE